MSKKKQALLLIHGIWSSSAEFGYISKHLASSELDIPAIDFKTYGLYGKEEKTPDFYQWVEEINAVYNELLKEYETVHIGGLSLGGSLALAFDILYPNTVNGSIIALAPILKLDGWAIPFYASFLIQLFCKINVMQGYILKESDPYGLKNKHIRAIAKKQFESGDQSIMGGNNIPIRFLNASYKLSNFLRKNLEKIQAPLLVIHSREDETASIYNARLLASKTRMKVFKKVELTNSYHIITWDNERKKVVQHIDSFIKEFNSLGLHL